MSSLSPFEKAKLESLFNMGGGYVLNFTNSTFASFLGRHVNIDIHDDKYKFNGPSKANKLRAFWTIESDDTVGHVTLALVECAESLAFSSNHSDLIAECKAIAGRLLAGNVNLTPLKNVTDKFDSNYLKAQIARMEQSVLTDPTSAIGSAKELIESCCKTILHERSIEAPPNQDIPSLTKATFRGLDLIPDSIHESGRGGEIIKRLLQNLSTIGSALSELRNLYGTGHGRHAESKWLEPRHAKLVVGAASALVTFLYESHLETKDECHKN